MKTFIRVLAVTVCVSLALWPASVPASEPDPGSWQFGASIYGWFPDISGETVFEPKDGGDFKIDIENILENLEFVLMGTFDARKGRWGLLADAIYMNVGDEKTGGRDYLIGGIGIPVTATANVEYDMESLIMTMLGYYRAVDKPGQSLDIVAGTRYLDVEQKVNWNLTGNIGAIPPIYRSGAAQSSLANWDAIIGVRGRVAFGSQKKWFVPYYADVGLGESDLTWQGVLGAGYAFHWGEITALWRYLYYDLGSGHAIKDMAFSGPGIGATFRW